MPWGRTMPVVSGSRPALPALALAALLSAAPLLVGCGAGAGGAGGGGVTGRPFYVASFRPGGGIPEEQRYVLTSESGPRIRIVTETPGVDPGPLAASSSQAGTPTAPAQTSGVSPSSAATGVPTPVIAWVNDGQYLAVITYGSGSCPDGPQSIRVVADQEVEVRLGPFFPGRDVCTADLGPYVTVVKLPQGVTPAKPLTARFGSNEATLPGASR
jgi:hypothetical protein